MSDELRREVARLKAFAEQKEQDYAHQLLLTRELSEELRKLKRKRFLRNEVKQNLQKAIIRGLKSYMKVHGALTPNMLNSAAKRISGALDSGGLIDQDIQIAVLRDENETLLAENERLNSVVRERIQEARAGMRQFCKDCGRTDGLDFLVSNETWNEVMTGVPTPGEGAGGVMCLECFDRRAKEAGIEYREEVVLFGTDAWQAAYYEGVMPQRRSGQAG